MLEVVALVSVLALGVLILLASFGRATASLVLLLTTLCLAPLVVWSPGSADVFHVGIAGSVPELRTYAVALLALALISLLFRGRSPITWEFLPLVIWLVFGSLLIWPSNELLHAGLLQIACALLAWAIGRRLGHHFEISGRSGRLLSSFVLAFVLLQVIVCSLQIVGLPINPMDDVESAILGNRTNGTSNHPNTLGKILVFLMILTLPLTRSPVVYTRKAAHVALFLVFLPLGMAQGRANLIAAILVVFVWALLLPREKNLGGRQALLAGTTLIGLGASGVVLARFDEDPTGGVRSEILAYAIDQIALRPLSGSGPNNYTAVAGPVTGSWIPVHNSFLLAAAELGIIGAALLLAPAVIVIVRAWLRRRGSVDISADAGRALIASAPAVILIGLTGWGLLGTSVFSLWFFATAFLAGVMEPSEKPGPTDAIERIAGGTTGTTFVGRRATATSTHQ